jgi:two-component system, OmpR family, sensor kinase
MAIALWIRQRVASLIGHLLITYVTVMLISMGGVIAWTGRQLAAETILQAQDQLQLQAQIIANALREPIGRPGEAGNNPSARSIPDLLASYAGNIGGRVSLVDSQQQVTASSDAKVALKVLASSPEFSSMRYDIRREAPEAEERLYVAAPIPSSPARPLGYVQLSVPMSPIYATINRKWLDLIGIGAVALVITTLSSFLLARRIAIPVQHLTETSEQIAAGRLNVRALPDGPTEVRRLGHVFNQMAGRVEQMNVQRREFVDNAAHELRSPLTGLRLRLDLLAEDESDDAALTRQYISKMQSDVVYLQRLVDQLLALASVEEGEAVEKTLTDLAPVVRDVAEEISLMMQQARIKFHVEVPDHLPRVNANVDQIRTILRNLLDNAMKYTHAGGTITVTASAKDCALEIQVADSGIGIPPDALPHIFERFYRAPRDRSRRQGGAGLGLSLARSMVEANNGSIIVESQVNQGSQFTIQLPIGDSTTQH